MSTLVKHIYIYAQQYTRVPKQTRSILAKLNSTPLILHYIIIVRERETKTNKFHVLSCQISVS